MNGHRSKLTRLTLERFKGFEAAHAPLGGFTVVVGTNASGKSNLREALRFLHGIGRGYTLAETIGEKWIEGGVLQWRGLRGGVREVAYCGAASFALEVELGIDDAGKIRDATYRIEVSIETSGRVMVAGERLTVKGRGEYIFDSHPSTNPPEQPSDPYHFAVRIKKAGQKGYVGKGIRLLSDRPGLAQLAETEADIPKDVRTFAREALGAFASMRFLDLSPDAMRLPSIPGQWVLGDRGENLSSVLQEICDMPARKAALVKWVRELTPLDVEDFRFVADQTGRLLVTLVEVGGRETSAYSASDGTLRFLAMVAAFLGREPARLYFFEELETGLHPTRLHLLLQLIEGHVGAGTSQVIATTHSPQLLAILSQSSVADSLVAYRLEGRSRQELKRLVDIPEAWEVLRTQNVSRLFASGWLEDAIAFSDETERE
jgi:predicted ATPase